MAKPNFSFKKRQREQAKEQKRKEKAERKLDRANEARAADSGGEQNFAPDGTQERQPDGPPAAE
ncbi:MAG: hypothetical protein O2973_01800 [Gemmatimonadetes bacterium]|nr:hypothetical protein [Gemmatimonadota bacterium]